MIIWGGSVYNNGSFYLNTGGRYSPVTDTWTATSTTDAPDGRESHTAIWTGNQMVVFGGQATNGRVFSSGGRYCAQTPPTYTLTYTAGPNGSISGNAPQTVNYGAKRHSGDGGSGHWLPLRQLERRLDG